ncbi:DUF1289 domain-containing protein [Thaumasiovibrio subtropicus]|uniref:DUF1289 domain-containing protein n=1 Tax=Thaumasiovibrio subtropicus TaxID=1891207 RepID=UPI000B3632FE|nr:DUF1289 domain-containing protein [Thaumasiovibrio subtropicus]
MEQLDFFAVPSPCRRICVVNNRGYCKGCFRSREERFEWLNLTNEQKRNVIRLCELRRKRVESRRYQQANATNEPTFSQGDLFSESEE